MANQTTDKLANLHTTLIDSRNGYTTALDEAGPDGIRDVIQSLLALRGTHIHVLDGHLRTANAEVDQNGSFMTTVHRTVISFQALFGDLTERILPGLIDGEKRILDTYDTAIEEARRHGSTWMSDLSRQRGEVEAAIRKMEARNAVASQ